MKEAGTLISDCILPPLIMERDTAATEERLISFSYLFSYFLPSSKSLQIPHGWLATIGLVSVASFSLELEADSDMQ